nr:metallophosphatase domain-containing protein [Kofleriaceae bacterium]
MRIVAVADTHLFHGDLTVPDGDAFVHAGDLCRGGDLDELREAAAWIAGLPHRHKLVVAGNHDWAFAREPDAARAVLRDTGILYLEDGELSVDGLRFYGSPWQPAFHDWAFNLRRGPELAAVWARVPLGLDVLVTHAPPAGIGDDSPVGGRAGCADLRARLAVVRPRVHLFGHIHQDGGLWERDGVVHANVTTWECERAPTVIDVDATTVAPVHVPPREPRQASGRDEPAP